MNKSNQTIKELIASGKFKVIKSKIDEDRIVNEIKKHLKKIDKPNTKKISLIGGAASGKSLLSKRLSDSLNSAEVICTDDYVIGDRDYRRKHIEGQDPTKKYDINFLKKKIKEICSLKQGQSVKIPTYNPKTGLAVAEGENNFKKSIKQVDYIIIEGDFDFVDDSDYKIFFHVPDEIRLQNRIHRDNESRNEPNPEKIIANFQSRQRLQQEPYTLPAACKSDLLIIVSAKENNEGFEYRYSMYLKK